MKYASPVPEVEDQEIRTARIEGFQIAAEDVGGRWARRLRYFPVTGKVLVKHLETHEAPDLADERQVYEEAVKSVRPGEIELFG